MPLKDIAIVTLTFGPQPNKGQTISELRTKSFQEQVFFFLRIFEQIYRLIKTKHPDKHVEIIGWENLIANPANEGYRLMREDVRKLCQELERFANGKDVTIVCNVRRFRIKGLTDERIGKYKDTYDLILARFPRVTSLIEQRNAFNILMTGAKLTVFDNITYCVSGSSIIQGVITTETRKTIPHLENGYDGYHYSSCTVNSQEMALPSPGVFLPALGTTVNFIREVSHATEICADVSGSVMKVRLESPPQIKIISSDTLPIENHQCMLNLHCAGAAYTVVVDSIRKNRHVASDLSWSTTATDSPVLYEASIPNSLSGDVSINVVSWEMESDIALMVLKEKCSISGVGLAERIANKLPIKFLKIFLTICWNIGDKNCLKLILEQLTQNVDIVAYLARKFPNMPPLFMMSHYLKEAKKAIEETKKYFAALGVEQNIAFYLTLADFIAYKKPTLKELNNLIFNLAPFLLFPHMDCTDEEQKKTAELFFDDLMLYASPQGDMSSLRKYIRGIAANFCGVEFIRGDIEESPFFITPQAFMYLYKQCGTRDFSRCKFVGDFSRVDFSNTDLSCADFSDANLYAVNFTSAILLGINFYRALFFDPDSATVAANYGGGYSIDLRGINLRSATLDDQGATFFSAFSTARSLQQSSTLLQICPVAAAMSQLGVFAETQKMEAPSEVLQACL